MKAHFTASLEGDKKIYNKIIQILQENHWELVTDHVLKRSIADVRNESPEEAERYARKMLAWIKKADVVISEISHSNVSVGYEITLALNLGKPVIVLHTKYNEPHALKGVATEKLQVCGYNTGSLRDVLINALTDAKDLVDVRFNFFISPRISVYLDWIAKNKKLPRAVYLRKLIEEDMKKNPQFNNG